MYSQGIGIGNCLSWMNVSMAFDRVRMVDRVKHASRTLGGASSSSPGIHRVGRLFIRQSHTLATTSSTSTLVTIVLYVDIIFLSTTIDTTEITNVSTHCTVCYIIYYRDEIGTQSLFVACVTRRHTRYSPLKYNCIRRFTPISSVPLYRRLVLCVTKISSTDAIIIF